MNFYEKIDKDCSIHGLDIGNATLINNQGLILDSKITGVEPLAKADKLFVDNKTVWLGVGKYDTEYNKVEKQNYMNFLYGLLALSTTTTHNLICVGLPLSQYRENKEQLINKIMSDNKKILYINDMERTIIIDDVFVAPEGIATLDDNFEGIVCDIGGRTSDVALVVNEYGKRKVINPISIPLGTIDLYTDFINKINSRYSLNLKIDDAARILKSGLTFKGRKQEINFALEMQKEFTESLISDLQRNYNLEINNISLTGGGAEIVYEQLKNRLGDGVAMQDNSILANAKAFYEIGLSVFLED
jgi:plasmid segregation protein ParM